MNSPSVPEQSSVPSEPAQETNLTPPIQQTSPIQPENTAVANATKKHLLVFVILGIILVLLITVLVLVAFTDIFNPQEAVTPTPVPSPTIANNPDTGQIVQNGYEIIYLEETSLKTFNTLTQQTQTIADIPEECTNTYKTYLQDYSDSHFVLDCGGTIQVYSALGKQYEIEKSDFSASESDSLDLVLSNDGNLLAGTKTTDSSFIRIYNHSAQSWTELLTEQYLDDDVTGGIFIGAFSSDNNLFYFGVGFGEGPYHHRYTYDLITTKTFDKKIVEESYFLGLDGNLYAFQANSIVKYDFTLENLLDTYAIGTSLYTDTRQTGDASYSIEVSENGQFLYIKSTDPACGYALIEDELQSYWQGLCPNPDERNKFIVYDTHARAITAQILQSESRSYDFVPGKDPSHLIQYSYGNKLEGQFERSYKNAVSEYSVVDKIKTEIFKTQGEIVNFRII